MIRLSLIILVSFFCSCKQRSKQPYNPSTNDVKSFFAQIDDSSFFKSKIPIVDSIETIYCKELFSEYAWDDPTLFGSDFFYILNQMNNTERNVWTDKIFDSSKIISTKNYNSISAPFYTFSLPYFTKDKKYCVLYYDLYIAIVGGQTSLCLYENKKGKWLLKKVFYVIMS